MTRRFNIAALKALAQAPADKAASWIVGAEESVEFLKANTQSEEIVIYASGPAILIHGVLAPAQQVTPADQEDLMRGFVQTDESWVIQKSYGGGEGHRVYLEPPLRHESKSLSGGEKLIFRRSFDGVQKGGADAVLAASIFHYGEYSVRQAKLYMAERGIEVRL